MRWILFLSRLAFICNIIFVFSVLLLWKDFLQAQAIISTVIIIGYFLAVFIFNPLVNISYLIGFFKKSYLIIYHAGWCLEISCF
jgi:hypothetical protein